MAKNANRLVWAATGSCLWAAAPAEVMDKEPALPATVRLAILGAFICGLLAYSRPKFLWCALPPILFFWFGLLSEIQDKQVGQAITHEAGQGYAVWVWAMPFICMLGAAIGSSA